MPVAPPATVNVRYMVHDVDAAIAWYTKHLGFTVLTNYAPAFADVTLGSLRLLLSGPTSSAGRPMPDGARPEAGGWNRVHLIVDDLPSEVARLRAAGVHFRNEHLNRLPQGLWADWRGKHDTDTPRDQHDLCVGNRKAHPRPQCARRADRLPIRRWPIRRRVMRFAE